MDVPGRLNIMCSSALSLAAIPHRFPLRRATWPQQKHNQKAQLVPGTIYVGDFSPNLCPSTPIFFFISCFPNIIVPFIPCTALSIHLPVTDARLLVLLTVLEPALYQPLHSPSPASISPAAAAEALSQVDGSRQSLTEPPCPPPSPPTPLIHLYTLYTDLERRGQIKKDRFPHVITPTHEFVAVSFVEFVFLLA